LSVITQQKNDKNVLLYEHQIPPDVILCGNMVKGAFGRKEEFL
jgi:hypothetical protein